MLVLLCSMMGLLEPPPSEPQIILLNEAIQKSGGKSVELYSQRGDLMLRAGRFAESVADYQKMVEIDRNLDVTHWRLGIALYYAGRYEESAKQFEKYQNIDASDRENGLWRYLAMQKGVGKSAARKAMIRYEKPDRPPFTPIYEMFEGSLPAKEFLKQAERMAATSKEYFYAHLYLGLYHGSENDNERALHHLKIADKSEWGRNALGGPGWMHSIARLHADHLKSESDRLAKESKKQRKILPAEKAPAPTPNPTSKTAEKK